MKLWFALRSMTLLLAMCSAAVASTTWYVDGVNGSDNNNCKSAQHACKTIGHAISLASSGDSIKVAPATYTENLTIGFNLKVIGAGATTTIIDGGGVNTVVTITSATVTLAGLTIQNGYAWLGGGISNSGTLTIANSTISGNRARENGGGIINDGTLTINNSTFGGNHADQSSGGGLFTFRTLSVNNSTISGNSAGFGGGGIGISYSGILTISNSTLSQNGAGYSGGNLYNYGTAILQNSIVADSSSGGNCNGTMTSKGYNLSSDNTCNFSGPGDLNNTDPKVGPLQNNGGPTQTQALLHGSPAIDAGNPKGCTDGHGHVLKTDQRGKPRPDKEDNGIGCDMGAYERQKD